MPTSTPRHRITWQGIGVRAVGFQPPGQRGTTHDPDERDAAFQSYLATTVHYFEVAEAAGDTPWFCSLEERREPFMRRYQEPDPPEGVPARTLAEIRGTTPVTTHTKDAA